MKNIKIDIGLARKILQDLTDEEAGALFKCLIYGNSENLKGNKANKVAYNVLMLDLEKDEKIYKKRVTTIKENTKNRHGNGNKDETQKKSFSPPTVDEVRNYCNEKHLILDAQYFVNYYSNKDWRIGTVKMKDWRLAAQNWAKRDIELKPNKDNLIINESKNATDFEL